MKTISRYNVYSNSWDTVVLFDSAMLAKLYQLDPEHGKKTCVNLIEINAKIPEPRESETPEQTIRRIEALERLDNLLKHGSTTAVSSSPSAAAPRCRRMPASFA